MGDEINQPGTGRGRIDSGGEEGEGGKAFPDLGHIQEAGSQQRKISQPEDEEVERLKRKQKPGFITEDERRGKDLPDGINYESWLLCRPENAEEADLHMVVFSEHMLQRAQPLLQKYPDDEAGHTARDGPVDGPLDDSSADVLSEKSVQVVLSKDIQNASMSDLWKALDLIVGEFESNARREFANRQTLFHLAAICGWTGIVKRLLERGRGKPLEKKTLADFFTRTDRYGFNPLHYIAWYGRFEILQVLLHHSRRLELAIVSCLKEKTLGKRSAFHLAARNGHARTLKLLISFASESKDCKLMELLTSKDRLGMTPLHLCALHGRQQATHLLLKNGAFADSRDAYERTPLHIAAIRGHTAVGESILESQGKQVVNMPAKDGKTALLYSCMRDKEDFVTMLLNHGADVHPYPHKEGRPQPSALQIAVRLRCGQAVCAILKSDRWEEAFAATGGERDRNPEGKGKRRVPVVKDITTVLAEEPDLFGLLLDKFSVDDEAYSTEFLLESPDMQPKEPLKRHYYFRYLYHHFQHKLIKGSAMDGRRNFHRFCSVHTECEKREDCINYEDSEVPEDSRCIVQTIIDHPNLKPLLLKPIIVQWMRKKWLHFARKLLTFNLFVYSLFLLFITILVGDVEPYQRCPHFIDKDHLKKYERGSLAQVSSVMVIILSIIGLLKEVFEFRNRGWLYFADIANYIEWPLYILAISFAFAGHGRPSKTDWIIGMIAITLAWTNLMLFLIRFTFFGIYIVMFIKILQTVLQVFIVYALFILGFGLSFYILLSEMENFDTVGRALATTLTFATDGLDLTEFFSIQARQALVDGSNYTCGNINQAKFVAFNSTDNAPQLNLLYPFWSWLYLVAFVFIGPIILTNMLTGLAVDDIADIRKKASEDIAERQATIILESERIVFFFAKIPHLKRILPEFYDEDFVNQDIQYRGVGDSAKGFGIRDIPLLGAIVDVFAFNLDADQAISAQHSFYESRLDNMEVTNKQIAKTMVHVNNRLDQLSSSHRQLTKTVTELGVQQMDSTQFENPSDTIHQYTSQSSFAEEHFPDEDSGQNVDQLRVHFRRLNDRLEHQHDELDMINGRLQRQEEGLNAIRDLLKQLLSQRPVDLSPVDVATRRAGHRSEVAPDVYRGITQATEITTEDHESRV